MLRGHCQVSSDEFGKITERQLLGLQATIRTNRCQVGLKDLELLGDLSATWDLGVSALGPKPRRDLLDALTRVGTVG